MHATGRQLDAEGEGVSADGIAGPDYVCEMVGFTAGPSPPLTLSPRCCNSWLGVFCAPALKQHIQYNTRNRPVSAGSESWWRYMVGRRDGDGLTPSHPIPNRLHMLWVGRCRGMTHVRCHISPQSSPPSGRSRPAKRPDRMGSGLQCAILWLSSSEYLDWNLILAYAYIRS